jgi:benzil reductase ((S)-benzoin forming)
MTTPRHSLALLTGTSSGIGLALAHDLLNRGWHVVGASRRPAPIDSPLYTHLEIDLGDFARLKTVLEDKVKPLVADASVQRVGLVNNAAAVALLGTLDQVDPSGLVEVYTVNTAAPVFLMGWTLRHARPGVPIRIVNVSTGAATTPLPGLGSYANAKAALRMAGMVLGAELEGRAAQGEAPDATILSFEPGIVDTPMQAAVRGSTAETVPIVQVFADWAASGALLPPEAPARAMAEYLESDGHPRWSEQRIEGSPPNRPA